MSFRSCLPQFSIRQLLVWTAFIGFACVSLRNASETWVSIALGVVLAILGATPMLVLLRQGKARAYWLGFASIAWLYIGLLLYSFALEPSTAISNPLSSGNLATARLAKYLHNSIYPPVIRDGDFIFSIGTPPQYLAAADGRIVFAVDRDLDYAAFRNGAATLRAQSLRLWNSTVSAPSGPAQEHFVNVAHALWTLLLAACGGWFARWLYGLQSRTEQENKRR